MEVKKAFTEQIRKALIYNLKRKQKERERVLYCVSRCLSSKLFRDKCQAQVVRKRREGGSLRCLITQLKPLALVKRGAPAPPLR